jgi:hypothetical protein
VKAVRIEFDESAETAQAIRDGLTEFNRKAVNFPNRFR